MKKGLLVEIYRDSYNPGPINKFHDRKGLLCIDMEGPFEPSEDYPAVRIVKRALRWGEFIHAEPLKPGNYAFGGSFIYTSDSRFSEVSKYPIPLHDRQMDMENKS